MCSATDVSVASIFSAVGTEFGCGVVTMPTYEYQCGNCQHKWEEFQSISAKPTKKCPECGKSKAERLISAGGGIIFRGSGFYQTDYRSDSYRKGAEAAKKASDGGGAGTSKSADAPAKSSKSDGGG